MPMFERHGARGGDRIAVEPTGLIMAGWTGRDRAAVDHHIADDGDACAAEALYQGRDRHVSGSISNGKAGPIVAGKSDLILTIRRPTFIDL